MLVSFLSNEDGETLQSDDTQAGQKKSDVVRIHHCAIKYNYLVKVYVSKCVWHSCHGYKNGLEWWGRGARAAFQ